MNRRIDLLENDLFLAKKEQRRLRDEHKKKMLGLPPEQRTKYLNDDLSKYIGRTTSLLYYYRMKNIKSDLSSNC